MNIHTRGMQIRILQVFVSEYQNGVKVFDAQARSREVTLIRGKGKLFGRAFFVHRPYLHCLRKDWKHDY